MSLPARVSERPPEGSHPADTLTWDSRVPELWEGRVCAPPPVEFCCSAPGVRPSFLAPAACIAGGSGVFLTV